ncbi:hypothetical protein EON65_27690 [archaeon]|nr:MAG: hypothetical protein EON65_27690 [archaeon]
MKILPDNFQSLVLRTWQPQPMKLTTLDYSTLLQGKLTCLTLFSEDKLNTKLRELINHGVAAPDAIEPEQALPGIANTDAIPLDPLGGLVEGSMSAALDPTNDIVGDYSSRLLHWKTGKKPPKLEDVLATRFLASFTQLPLLYFHDNALFKQKIEKSVKFLLSCRHLLATLPRVIEDTAQANNLDFACLSAWIDM